MPELPEVETVVRGLAPALAGRRIVRAVFESPWVVREDPLALAERVAGRLIRDVKRRGKFILIALEDGVLSIHLGMTGKLVLGAAKGPYTRALFELDSGLLCYDDIRHFGRIEWAPALPPRVARLGPDPLEISFADFYAMLRRHRARLKPLLLNQSFVGGLGNIYVDETLFRARLHPLSIASRIGRKRAEALYQAMRETLTAAIEHRGSSVSDYVGADGRKGSFQLHHRVYRKQGQPCPNCGTPIRRAVVAQRGTHYCPKCQRK